MRADVAALTRRCGPAPIHLSGTKWQRVDDMNANPHGATLEFEGNRGLHRLQSLDG